jgi:hypothetical protein
MKIFDNSADLLKELGQTTLRAPLKMQSLNYPYKIFNCGCSSKTHNLADLTNSIFADASKGIFSIRFVIRCRNDYFTLVSIKGVLKIKADSEWTVSKKIFNESLKIIKLPGVDTIKPLKKN